MRLVPIVLLLLPWLASPAWAVTLIGTTQVATGSGTTCTVNVPGGAANNTLVGILFGNGGATVTTNDSANLTVLPNTGGHVIETGTGSVQAYPVAGPATGSPPASVQFTTTGTAYRCVMRAFSGVLNSPITVDPNTASNPGSTASNTCSSAWPGLTPTLADGDLVQFIGIVSYTSGTMTAWSQPTTCTNCSSFTDPTFFANASVSVDSWFTTQTPKAATGTISSTPSGTTAAKCALGGFILEAGGAAPATTHGQVMLP